MKPMNILITGAASGIGKVAAEFFIKQGHFVWGIDSAETQPRENYRGFTADIRDEAALQAVCSELFAAGTKLSAIINAAGIHDMFSLTESDAGDMKRLADVDFWGTVLVNRVFHRLLSADGRIVIVTSEVAGFAPLPFNGLYSAVKTAQEAYAHALRQEVNLIGQKVITVRPGAVETPLSRRSSEATARLAQSTQLYKKQARNFVLVADAFKGKPIPPETAAKVIGKAVLVKRPRLTYNIHHNPGLVLLDLLPKRWQCAAVKLLLRPDLSRFGKGRGK